MQNLIVSNFYSGYHCFLILLFKIKISTWNTSFFNTFVRKTLKVLSTNNPVVKVEGRRPETWETLTTGLFVLSIPGMAT